MKPATKKILAFGILVIATIFGMNLQTQTTDIQTEALTPQAAIVDVGFLPGTQRLGDVAIGRFNARIGVNASLNIDNATVTLYNSSDDAVATSSLITSFPSTVYLDLSASEASKTETYFMNVTAITNETEYEATSGYYYNNPTYDAQAKQYGRIWEIQSTQLNNTLAYKAMYHPNRELIGVVAPTTQNISIMVK